MKKLFYFISRIFFSKKKLLLIKLLNEVQDSTDFVKNEMRVAGICMVMAKMFSYNKISRKDYIILYEIILSNRPHKTYSGGFYFEPHVYQPRFEYLKELIKKY